MDLPTAPSERVYTELSKSVGTDDIASYRPQIDKIHDFGVVSYNLSVQLHSNELQCILCFLLNQ